MKIYCGEWVDMREGRKFAHRLTDKKAKTDCERAEQKWTDEPIQWEKGKKGDTIKWIGKTKYHTFYVNQYEVKS
jgi:hypothetical protein